MAKEPLGSLKNKQHFIKTYSEKINLNDPY